MFYKFCKFANFVIDAILITSNNQKHRDFTINHNIKHSKK